MKTFLKILSLTLAALFLITCFVACGGGQDESETQGPDVETETDAPKETEKRDEYGRLWIDDSIPADANYSSADKNTLTFFVRENGMYFSEIDVDEITDDTFRDAVYYRNTTVEERLGVTITQVAQPSASSSERNAWLQNLRNAVNTKTLDFDCATIYASQGSPLALEGCFYNVLNMETLDLEKPWWNQDMVKDLTLFDAMFFLGGNLTISQVKQSKMIFYNKDIFKEYYPTNDIYETVTDYQWTIDELYNLSSPIWVDKNSSGVADDGDIVGFTGWGASAAQNDTWQAAMGLQIITKNDEGIPELSLYSDRAVTAFEKLVKLHLDNPGALAGVTDNTKYALGNVLFAAGSVSEAEAYRDMGDTMGVLPYPMLDAEQGRYGTYPQNSCSLLTVLSTIEPEREAMIGHILELMSAESYRQTIPKYYEVCLKTKYSSDVGDAMMYDIILDSIRFDLGYVYGTKSIAGVNGLFRDLTKDFAQLYESNETSYQTALDALINKLDEIAFVVNEENKK